mmetsp:Transcript_16872/g.37855  ORF Transcript_16872/g.37855 Transcript_16872/m.37855 type:complete len:247 (-) Transcript_16872:379-1119(-)
MVAPPSSTTGIGAGPVDGDSATSSGTAAASTGVAFSVTSSATATASTSGDVVGARLVGPKVITSSQSNDSASTLTSAKTAGSISRSLGTSPSRSLLTQSTTFFEMISERPLSAFRRTSNRTVESGERPGSRPSTAFTSMISAATSHPAMQTGRLRDTNDSAELLTRSTRVPSAPCQPSGSPSSPTSSGWLLSSVSVSSAAAGLSVGRPDGAPVGSTDVQSTGPSRSYIFLLHSADVSWKQARKYGL